MSTLGKWIMLIRVPVLKTVRCFFVKYIKRYSSCTIMVCYKCMGIWIKCGHKDSLYQKSRIEMIQNTGTLYSLHYPKLYSALWYMYVGGRNNMLYTRQNFESESIRYIYVSISLFLACVVTVPATLFLTFLSCSIVRVSYRIVRVSYHIVRVSYRIVYQVFRFLSCFAFIRFSVYCENRLSCDFEVSRECE
jgi:Zn-finger nucleic acid-binding protein